MTHRLSDNDWSNSACTYMIFTNNDVHAQFTPNLRLGVASHPALGLSIIQA